MKSIFSKTDRTKSRLSDAFHLQSNAVSCGPSDLSIRLPSSRPPDATKRPEELPAKENKKPKKIIDWITYAVNMLLALPVFGLISCAIFWLTYPILSPRSDPPEWALWSFPILPALFLIVLWGQYQYRILILKTPHSSHETKRNLLILAGCVTIAFLLIFGLVYYLEEKRMEKLHQKIEQIKKMSEKSNDLPYR